MFPFKYWHEARTERTRTIINQVNCHYNNDYYTQQAQNSRMYRVLQTLLQDWRWKRRPPLWESNPQPSGSFFWQVFWLYFSSISSAQVYWLSSGMYAQVLRIVVVAFLVVWVEPDQQPVLHLPKQHCPTAWITALRYQCPRVLKVFNYQLFYYEQKWVSSVKSKIEAAVVDKRNMRIDADSWLW